MNAAGDAAGGDGSAFAFNDESMHDLTSGSGTNHAGETGADATEAEQNNDYYGNQQQQHYQHAGPSKIKAQMMHVISKRNVQQQQQQQQQERQQLPAPYQQEGVQLTGLPMGPENAYHDGASLYDDQFHFNMHSDPAASASATASGMPSFPRNPVR